MTYLYGDSDDSGLELNYIELLRDFLDFAVQIMLSEQRIEESIKQAEAQHDAANTELDQLRVLGETVIAALENTQVGQKDSATAKSAETIRQTTQETLRRAAESLRSQVAATEQDVAVRKTRERAGDVKIAERLLLHQTLPDSTNAVAISINAEGTAYDAAVIGTCKQGLDWRFAAEIPPENQFHEVLKVSSLVPELNIDLPEMSGLIRKSVKLKSYRVSTLYLTGLANDRSSVLLKLRSAPISTEPTGLDVQANQTTGRVMVKRIEKGEESELFQVSDEDAAALIKICADLAGDRGALVEHRAKLIALKFDGDDLSECPDPKVLVRRLVDRIGPVIQKIAEHSLAKNELVLKRILANDRREEIFASRTDLIAKLSGVSIGLRGIFAPLGLGDLGTGQGSDSPANITVDPPTTKQTRVDDPDSEPTRVKQASSESSLVDIEDEATLIASGPGPETSVVIDALAPDEEHKHAVTGSSPPAPIDKIPRTKKNTVQTRTVPPPPPPPKAVEGDSIDVALAELDSET